MATNYRKMTVPTLISKVSAPRKAEAQFRLDTWNMSEKNVRRLTAYLGEQKADPTPKPKADRPQATRKAKASAQAKKAEATADLKSQAKQAWDAAFAQADDGDRQKAARKAYGLVMRGTPLADVLAAIG